MPIYEYRCAACGKRFSVLTLRISEKLEPRCEHCGSMDARRQLSRFAMPKSDATRAASVESNFGDVDESDPASMARWMKEVGNELGEGGDEFEEMVDEIQSSSESADD